MFRLFTTGNWLGVGMPVVKRVFPELLSKTFVSVQPMSAPSGLIFYLDFWSGIIIWDEELWLEDDGKGGLYCPQIRHDGNILDKDWEKTVEDRLIIPAWEVERDYGRFMSIVIKSEGTVWYDE